MNSEIIKMTTISLYIRFNKKIIYYKKPINQKQQIKYNKEKINIYTNK